MKLKHFFTALVLLAVLAITSCKTSFKKEALVGKWKVTDVASKSPGLTPAWKAQYMEQGNTIEFTKDGNYTAWSKGKEDDKGTYTLLEDGKTIVTKPAKGADHTILMKELTKDKMIATLGVLDLTFEPSK